MHTLQNGRLTVTLRPDLGGRIDQLVDESLGKRWLWHPPGYRGERRALPVGASFDDHWSGGFDEIFPSDAACRSQGRDLPVHGELWSQPWEVLEESSLGIRLRYSCRSVPVDVEKSVELDPRWPELSVVYRLRNRADEAIDYLLKLHPALAIEAGDEILMPRCLVRPVDLGFSRILTEDDWRPWSTALLGVVPPKGKRQELVYAKDLEEGRVGLRSHRTASILWLDFSRQHFPYVWLFQTYGGWRNHYTLVVEPATNIPWDLAAARSAGSCARIGPREHQLLELQLSLEDR